MKNLENFSNLVLAKTEEMFSQSLRFYLKKLCVLCASVVNNFSR